MSPALTPLGDSSALAQALKHLAETIDARAGGDAAASWTAKLLSEGPGRCAKKFGEEAVEFALAIASEDETKVASEAADVLYHLMVALRARGVSLEAVAQQLAARQGKSGLEEKASRA
jgi:phosphoribosyl-ATP pyrophosphohydrolase/phosphoribosyl-ATP pyrophosphohydrolase/phosphoribosyl-AMP cyclohydrolase